jgi:hypothetical protein
VDAAGPAAENQANGLFHTSPGQRPGFIDGKFTLQAESLHHIFWQGGYGAFSVGYSQLDDLVRYVDNQEVHHRTRTFQEEYRDLLRRYNVPFEERYVWD